MSAAVSPEMLAMAASIDPECERTAIASGAAPDAYIAWCCVQAARHVERADAQLACEAPARICALVMQRLARGDAHADILRAVHSEARHILQNRSHFDDCVGMHRHARAAAGGTTLALLSGDLTGMAHPEDDDLATGVVRVRLLEALLSTLTARQRTVWCMHRESARWAEVAEAAGCSIRTAQNELRRADVALASAIEGMSASEMLAA